MKIHGYATPQQASLWPVARTSTLSSECSAMPRTDDAGCLRRALRHRLDNLTDGLKSTYLMAHADSVLIEDEEPEASDLEVIAEESNEIRLSPLEPPPRNRTRDLRFARFDPGLHGDFWGCAHVLARCPRVGRGAVLCTRVAASVAAGQPNAVRLVNAMQDGAGCVLSGLQKGQDLQ